jgi:hypothetical protein
MNDASLAVCLVSPVVPKSNCASRRILCKHLGADFRLSVSCVTFGCESENFNDSAVVDGEGHMPVCTTNQELAGTLGVDY